jgi:hypothetical protein
MVQSPDDQFDWTIFSGPTPSSPTGPDAAYTGQFYIYIEASNPRKRNDTAKIYLPLLNDVTSASSLCVSFSYHMFGYHIRELQLFIESADASRTSNVVWRATKEKGNFWLQAAVQVANERNQRIGFVGVRGDEFSGDIALDHIVLTRGNC